MEEDGFVDVSFMLHCAVYALARKQEVVYIGQSKKPLIRVYSHANARGKREPWKAGYRTQKVGFHFDEIWIRPCMLAELDELEVMLIRKYQPKYNTKHNPASRGPVQIPDDIRALIASISIPPVDTNREPRLASWRRGL